MRSLATAALLLGAPVLAVAAEEDVPRTLIHSGRLLGGSDQPLSGSQTITFRIFPDLVAPPGEKPLWTEKYAVTLDASGVYTVQLGEPTDENGNSKTMFPADLFDRGAAFLEIAVGDSPQTLSPRMPLGTVPYALRARNALALGGKDASQWQPKVTAAGPLALDASGNLSIGLAGAQNAGALSAADWSTFNGKQDKLVPAAPLAIDAGSNLTIATASAQNAGALSAADWATFNAKQDKLTVQGPLALDAAGNLAIGSAGASTAGALSAADWNTFNGKQDKLTPTGPLSLDAQGHLAIAAAKPGSAGVIASVAAPLTLDGSGNLGLSTSGFIANGTSAQAGASLNIGGSATVGTLTVNGGSVLTAPVSIKNGGATRFSVDTNGNATVQSTLVVNSSSPINPNQAAGQATFEYPYTTTFTVGGDPNTFYPVAFYPAANGGVPGKFVIARAYYDAAPMTSETPDSAHLGGLQAVFSTMNTSWADYSYLTLEHYRYTYVRQIADCGILPAANNGKAVWCRLRGGGFAYHLWANYDMAPEAVTPGGEAYSDSRGYLFKYPAALPAASASSTNAFATGHDTAVSAY